MTGSGMPPSRDSACSLFRHPIASCNNPVCPNTGRFLKLRFRLATPGMYRSWMQTSTFSLGILMSGRSPSVSPGPQAKGGPSSEIPCGVCLSNGEEDSLTIANAAVETVSATMQATDSFRPDANESLSVLLAEDSVMNQKLAMAALQKHGHEVVVVNDGRDAVTAIGHQDFDLVLMDVQMPDMDGFEATRAIRLGEQQTGGHIPIIAMTAHTLKEDRDRCLNAGMDDYVTKPIHVEELLQTMDRTVIRNGNGRAREEKRIAPCDIDLSAVSAAMGNDPDLIQLVVESTIEECPGLLTAIGAAIAAGNAKKLRLHAHTLKGVIRHFGETQAHRHAFKLEQMGQQGSLEAAEEVHASLQTEIACMIASLRDWTEGKLISSSEDSPESEPPHNSDRSIRGPLEDMRTHFGDEQAFLIILEEFPGECEKLMSQIRRAREATDAKAIAWDAHKLKGLVSFFGVEQIQDIARNMELAGEISDFDTFDNIWPEAERHVRDLMATVITFRQEISHNSIPSDRDGATPSEESTS